MKDVNEYMKYHSSGAEGAVITRITLMDYSDLEYIWSLIQVCCPFTWCDEQELRNKMSSLCNRKSLTIHWTVIQQVEVSTLTHILIEKLAGILFYIPSSMAQKLHHILTVVVKWS